MASKKAVTATTATSASGIQTLLDTIYAKEKSLAKTLRAPASPGAVETLRSLEVPNAMRALYALHDGAEDPIFGPYQLLPVEAIVEERKTMNELLAANPSWSETQHWDARWVPFLADGDGQYFCVDPAGSCDGGKPGQILFFDHEVGPQRELTSFDVLVGLLTKLAKKKLLGEAAWESNEEEIEEIRAEARSVGLPKMTPKERKTALANLEKQKLPGEQKLDALAGLVRQYGADEELWREVRELAETLKRWPLVVEAAETRMRLVSRDDKNWELPSLFLGLHRMQRDEEAIAVLRAGLERVTNANERRAGLIPEGIDRALRQRALQMTTEIHPKDVESWWLLGSESTDSEARMRGLKTVVALVEATESPTRVAREAKVNAMRLLDLERLSSLAPAARLDALVALAENAGEDAATIAWTDVVGCATDLQRWDVAATAGAKLIELTSEYSRYEVARFQVRALHALGRDDEALAIVREVISACPSKWNDACFVAIPNHEERMADNVERTAADAAFEARCFAIVTEICPDNLDAWRWRRTFAAGSEKKATLEALAAFCADEVAAHDGDPDYDEDTLADLRRLEKEARAELLGV